MICTLKKELLKLTGKLAMACDCILLSNPKTLSESIKIMEKFLLEYNNAIINNIKEEMKQKDN